jgi:DivIVA domain-containing protein
MRLITTATAFDRRFVERHAFSKVLRGYDPAEVDNHLRDVADALAELKHHFESSPPPLAEAASDELREIVAVGESVAERLRSEAQEQAERVVADAEQRAEAVEAEATAAVDALDQRVRRIGARAERIEATLDSAEDPSREVRATAVEALHADVAVLRIHGNGRSANEATGTSGSASKTSLEEALAVPPGPPLPMDRGPTPRLRRALERLRIASPPRG